jgi:hypothetical protein
MPVDHGARKTRLPGGFFVTAGSMPARFRTQRKEGERRL